MGENNGDKMKNTVSMVVVLTAFLAGYILTEFLFGGFTF